MEFEKLRAYRQVLFNQVYYQNIQKNEQDTKTWTQYRDRHKKIIEGLETISSELSINCMVPLGKKALMKGKLTHTNEILVCIGDGYLVKYSAQQAIALCNRRIERSEEMLKNLEKERILFETRQMLPLDSGAFEYGECKDVTELWDEEKLKDWKVEHRKKEQEYRQKLIKLKRQKKPEVVTEDDLFKRLDELELEEELADELNRLEEEHLNFFGEDGQMYEETDESEDEADEESGIEEGEKIVDKKEENEAENTESKAIINNVTVEESVSQSVINEQSETKFPNANNEKLNESVPKPVEKTEIPTHKDTKINGKFEVSIIKEEEVKKMLGISSAHLELKPDSSLDGERKSKKNIKFDDSLNQEHDSSAEKPKGSGRRVSFAEPMEINSICDKNSDSEQDSDKESNTESLINTNCDDDIIRIHFKHSDTEISLPERTENEITNPQDIYTVFCKPKSILKRPLDTNCYVYPSALMNNNCFEEEDSECESIEPDSVVKSTYNLVVQDIRERNLAKQNAESNEPATKKQTVSRFKLERASLKK